MTNIKCMGEIGPSWTFTIEMTQQNRNQELEIAMFGHLCSECGKKHDNFIRAPANYCVVCGKASMRVLSDEEALHGKIEHKKFWIQKRLEQAQELKEELKELEERLDL